MTRFTLEYLDSLIEPVATFGSAGSGTEIRAEMEAFARKECAHKLQPSLGDTSEPTPARPEFIARGPLLDFAHRLRLDDDVELVEIVVLALMRESLRTAPVRETSLPISYVLQRISDRVHTLLEARPEYLHPNLAVFDVHAASHVLGFLVSMHMLLDPERLKTSAMEPGRLGEVAQEMLASPTSGASSLLLTSLRRGVEQLPTSRALIEATDVPLVWDKDLIDALCTACSSAAISSQAGFDDAMDLLASIGRSQDVAGGQGHRLAWPGASDVFDTTDMSWASARHAHPVLGFIYITALATAYVPQAAAADAPDAQIGARTARVATALNALFDQDSRLDLSQLSGESLLKLLVLSTHAAIDADCRRFWKWPPSAWGQPNLCQLVHWAAAQPDSEGRPVSLAFLDSLEDRLVEVMGSGHFNGLRAKVIQVQMSTVLNRNDCAPREDECNDVSAPWRRRARMI